MLLGVVSIGLGLVAPIGDLAGLSSGAKEIKISFVEPRTFPTIAYTISAGLINLTREELNIDIFQITEGAKVRVYKKLHLSAGIGAYHIRARTKGGEEWSGGFCSYYGVTFPYKIGKTNPIIPEITYYTVPKGLSFTLNFGISI